jgi:hypothetical protein
MIVAPLIMTDTYGGVQLDGSIPSIFKEFLGKI